MPLGIPSPTSWIKAYKHLKFTDIGPLIRAAPCPSPNWCSTKTPTNTARETFERVSNMNTFLYVSIQIIWQISKTKGLKNHPCSNMWKNKPPLTIQYWWITGRVILSRIVASLPVIVKRYIVSLHKHISHSQTIIPIRLIHITWCFVSRLLDVLKCTLRRFLSSHRSIFESKLVSNSLSTSSFIYTHFS
jgi:hypothetical protein